MLVLVLIESDWNLKIILLIKYLSPFKVLIESDWNLKLHGKAAFCETGTVLIESDWNLKIVRTFDDFKIGLKY